VALRAGNLVALDGFQPDYWRTWVDRDAGPGMDAGKIKGAPPADALSARGFEVQGKQGGLLVQPLDIFAKTSPRNPSVSPRAGASST